MVPPLAPLVPHLRNPLPPPIPPSLAKLETNPSTRNRQATEPFFRDIARRYGIVHRYFARPRALRRRPLRVAAEIRNLRNYVVVLGVRIGPCGCGCGGVGGGFEMLVEGMERLAGRLEEKGR